MRKNIRRTIRPQGKGPSRLLTVILLAIAILTTGVIVGLSRQKASAEDPKSASKAAMIKDDKTYITRYVGGQRIQIDPQTGQVKPLTPEEAKKLAEGLKEVANKSSEGLQQVHHADGSVSMDLEGRFQNVALGRKNADGTVSQSCVDSPEAGAAFFQIDPSLVGADVKPATGPKRKQQSNKQ